MTGHRKPWIVRKNRTTRRYSPPGSFLTFNSIGALVWVKRRPARWMRKRLRREVPPIDPTKEIKWVSYRFTYEPA